MDYMDEDIAEIARINRESWAGKPLIAIVEEGGQFWVHQHFDDGVCPASAYNDARQAVARVMQLLHMGPVAPQTWPETCCIGSIDVGEPE